MTIEQALRLGNLLMSTRDKLGLSAREVARRGQLNVSQVRRLEQGRSLHPDPETLRAIARGLGMPASGIFATAYPVSKDQLPDLHLYLRTKYGELSERDIAQIEALFDRLAPYRPKPGPSGGEDERP